MNKNTLAVLIACFLTVLIAYSVRYSYGTLLPEMLTSLSITKAQAGVIYASYFIAYSILSPIFGLLSDRINMRVLISVFVAVMGVGTFLMQFPTSVVQASIFFTIAGIGCAACWAPVMALAQRWISDKHRGLNLAIIDAGSSLGVMMSGAFIPVVVAGFDWQMGWRILGIAAIVLGAVDLILIRNRPASEPKKAPVKYKGQGKLGGMTYRQVLRDRRFWLIGLAYLLTGFVVIIPFTFISTYAVQELSFPYGSATLLITIIGAGGLLGKLTLGPLSDKIGRLRILILCAIILALGSLGIAYSRGIALMVICGLFGIGYGACWALYAACASDFFSKQSAGGIIGLWTFFLGVGSIMAPIIAGWTADTTGTLMWAFVMAAVAGIGSLLLLLPVLRAPHSVPLKSE
jgi:MFS transporter, OFA family, oxalate/formate antiporter